MYRSLAQEYKWPPDAVSELTMYQALVYFGANPNHAPARNSTPEELAAFAASFGS